MIAIQSKAIMLQVLRLGSASSRRGHHTSPLPALRGEGARAFDLLLALVRVASSASGLTTAPVVGCVLSPGLSAGAAVAAWRTRPREKLETK